MNAPSLPEPAKLIAALLWRDEPALEKAIAALCEKWGAIDYSGSARPFDTTDYYERELGAGLRKRIVSFERLVPTEALLEVKLACREIEGRLSGPSGRTVNIDPGYLDVHKVVFASVKAGWQKIHLGRGVHADMTCRFTKGGCLPLEWAFADYRSGLHDADFLAIRALYKLQLRGSGGGRSKSSGWLKSHPSRPSAALGPGPASQPSD